MYMFLEHVRLNRAGLLVCIYFTYIVFVYMDRLRSSRPQERQDWDGVHCFVGWKQRHVYSCLLVFLCFWFLVVLLCSGACLSC